jgi:hypothetical protein
MKVDIDDLFKRSGLKLSDIIGLCPYGSRVYGTAESNSDYDFLVIVHDKKTEQWSDNKYNLQFETLDSYQEKLWNHEVVAVETHYSEWIIKKFKPIFKLDLVKIRHSFSEKASNSWVKAYKKLSVEKDYNLKVAQKSLFHSLRILDFGIQLGTIGRIDRFDISNQYWLDIRNISDWTNMKEKYKEIYNQKSTEFRKVCPKV